MRPSVRSGRPYGAEDWVEVISHRLGIVREPRVVVVRLAKRCSDTGIPPDTGIPREKML